MGPDKPALPLVDLDIVIKCSKLWVRRLVDDYCHRRQTVISLANQRPLTVIDPLPTNTDTKSTVVVYRLEDDTLA